jgi:lysophospholipase L1-like esterase
MTPVREFLYFLILLTIFSVLLFLWKGDEGVPAPKPVIQEPLPALVQESPAPDDTLNSPESEPMLVDTPVVQPPEPELFYPVPLVFAEDDSLRFQLLARQLKQASQAKLPVRVVYFGDSQIETDRITSALRKQLQEQFTGRGPGFVPMDLYYNIRHKLHVEMSKNWEIKTFQDKDFTNQSLLFKNALLSSANAEGWFRIKRIRRLNPGPDYQLMKLYYTAKDSCLVKVRQGREIIYSGYLLPQNKISTLDFQFNRTPDDIRFDFTAKDSLNIAGLSLETGSGVLVDNIALRGLSYPTFTSSDQETISQMLGQVTVGLFVLHFGVNLVPVQADDYPNFRRNFQRQIDFLKRIRPEVPILIIGVSDMAQKHEGQFVSYPNIPVIKQIQYEIAMQNHAAFWDLQAFMGGEGAMSRWVDADPALGRTDYVHFSDEGAEIVGQELARILLEELQTTADTLAHD